MPVTPPPITPVPLPAPQRGDRDTFSDRVDAFVTWLENAPEEFEALAQNVYDNASIAEGSGDVATVGLGIVTANPFLSNIDNPAAISAFWVVTASTTGTFPTGGARDGMVINKLYGTRGFQMFQPAGADELWYRRRDGSAYGAWIRLDNKLSQSGGILTGDLTMAYGAPVLLFTETDQAGAAGKWRQIFNADTWVFQKNTAAGGDFSAVATPFNATSGGVGQVNGAVPVQQGTGVAQASNTIKIGWGTSNGLKATVDSTDQGYFAFSTTNPTTGTITFGAGTVAMQNVTLTTVTASGMLSANAGLTVAGASTSIQGGALATLGNNGYMQIGLSSGLNVVHDYTNTQARNNGAAATLNLNSLGGLVQVGAGGISTSGNISATGNIVADLALASRVNSALKVVLQNGTTVQGYLGADSTYCFRNINAANTLFTFYVDNSGNATAAGNITANSDERLKTNWRNLPEDFLEKLADIVLLGLYDRIDTGKTQIGMSAQQVQAFAPELVEVDPETGILSLDYGKLGAVAAAFLARRNRQQKAEIETMKAQLKYLMLKAGDK